MGKKGRRVRSSRVNTLPSKPFVSVCTPTFNRRPFIPALIECFKSQTYDSSKMEWIVVDDGTDSVEDLFADVPNVKYYRETPKMPLGKKRNYMHSKCKGDVIVYMDDDDYYPNTRVAHAVARLKESPEALCAGSSAMHTYFPDLDQVWMFGPYGDRHCTAASMAFKRALLTRTSYEDGAALAEEKHFLKNYTIPFVQLDPLKTMTVVAHAHNTFDKHELIENGPDEYAKLDSTPISELISDPVQCEFYSKKVHTLLLDYPDGLPDKKPEVKEQYNQMKEKREAARRNAFRTGVQVNENGKLRELSTDEVLASLQQQVQAIEALKARVQARDALIEKLRAQLIAEQQKNEQKHGKSSGGQTSDDPSPDEEAVDIDGH